MNPDWQPCGKIAGVGKPRCRAARVPGAAYCWAHLDPDSFADALESLRPGYDLDLRGTEVKQDLLAQILDRLRREDKDSTIEIGELRCQQAVFAGPVTFDKITVARGTSFDGARFTGSATFTMASFGEDFCLTAATLDGEAVFTDIKFRQIAAFAGLQGRLLRLSGITGATIDFTDACVTDEFTIDRAHITDTLILSGLRAAGPVDIHARAATVTCQNADFAKRTRFRLTGTRMRLVDTVFAQPASVESAGDLVQLYSLQGVDAEHLTLANVDLSHCLVSGMLRPEQLRLEGRCEFASAPRGWKWRYHCIPWRWTTRDTLFEENLWRKQHQVPPLGWSAERPDLGPGVQTASAPPDAAQLAVLYRQLRRSVEDARNEPGAADLYYGEMEMRRLSTRRWDERTLLTAYWLVSGYGLRASRALLVLATLLLIAAEVLQQIGFVSPSHGYADYLLYSSGSSLSLDLVGSLPTTLTDWGQVVRMILRIGGPVLLGLAALALRGRIRR